MRNKKKDIINKAKHYPTVLVGLSGWSETIKAIKKRRREQNGKIQ